jgi:hypothetical protein
MALAAGEVVFSVAKRFNLDRHSLMKHWRTHVEAKRKAELIGGPLAIQQMARRAAAEDQTVMVYFSILRGDLFRLFQRAKTEGRVADASLISRRLIECLEAIGRLTGELRQAGITIHNQQNNIAAPVIFADAEVAKFQGHGPRCLKLRGCAAMASQAELAQGLAGALRNDWPLVARPEQLPPPGDWSVWLYLAGRGAGKTRSGVEWILSLTDTIGRIALVAPTASDCRDIIVEGSSGILASSPNWNRQIYESSKRRVTWNNGAIATMFSSEEPDRLRGPQCAGILGYAEFWHENGQTPAI